MFAQQLTGGADFGSVNVTSEHCNPDGSGTFDYTASGTATGPYPGTYTETGSFTTTTTDPVGPEPLAAFNATFTIDSPVGHVTGTKMRVPNQVDGGVCNEDPGVNRQSNASTLAAYNATITGTFGTCSDQGSGSASLVDSRFVFSGIGGFTTFYEDYTSTSSGPLTCMPLLPTSKDQCKKGGWEQYGVFKNQGDCVSFVATGGKNPPAGP